MDCNMASSIQWDWDTLVMSNPSKTEYDEKQQSTEWDFEKGEGLESLVPDFLGLESIVPGSSPGDSCSNIDFSQVKASKDLEVYVASAESDLCLKLGKRTNSEEFWGRNNNDVSAVSMKLLTPSIVTRKKSKSYGQSMQVPRCQIDGCYLDLSSAKDYHRKHGVCENHSKCPKVIVSGLECRFCQQCSRFHAVSEFDEKKRSCRKRLSHHNARRRKPQGIFSMNPETVNDRRQHSSMLWNGFSLNTKSEETYLWGTTYETKPRQKERGFTLSFKRGNGYEEQLFASNNLSFSTFQTSSKFSARKSNIQLPENGLGECSGGLHESQDFYTALSLLSTSSDPRGTKHNPDVEPQPVFGTIATHFI